MVTSRKIPEVNETSSPCFWYSGLLGYCLYEVQSPFIKEQKNSFKAYLKEQVLNPG